MQKNVTLFSTERRIPTECGLCHLSTIISHFILASRSPRRRELMLAAGYDFDLIPTDDAAEDKCRSGESPVDYVRRLARQKAENVAAKVAGGIVIGCDTVVVCQGEILGKPADRDDAGRMLHLLRGTKHHVVTGICLWQRPHDTVDVRHETTKLFMNDISEKEIEMYLDSNLWVGKAGGFGYQDRNDWLHVVSGSESNVVGLPLELLAGMIETQLPTGQKNE